MIYLACFLTGVIVGAIAMVILFLISFVKTMLIDETLLKKAHASRFSGKHDLRDGV